jgi:hypothetical protein
VDLFFALGPDNTALPQNLPFCSMEAPEFSANVAVSRQPPDHSL